MDKPLRPPPHREEARRLTETLRTSDKPVWVAVREFLTQRGIDPHKSPVGEWGPEQSGEVGVFVAPDRTAFELEVEWSPGTIEVVSLRDLVDPDLRFVWGHGAFAATSLLEEETPTGIRPLDVLVEYLAHLNEQFRGLLTRPMPWAREDLWSVLVTHLRDHSIDPSTAVVLHWGMSSEEVDGGLLDTQGRCFHFTGSLVTSRGPIGEVITWDELSLSEARSIYGDLVDAGLELLRQMK
jgi:hypothetical protein